MNEVEFVELLKVNDDKAFKVLYRYFPKIKTYLKSFGASNQEVEDIYHEAIYILMEKLKDAQFELTASVNTYLFAVCKNLLISLNRTKNKHVKLDSEPEDQVVIDIAEDQKFERAQKAFRILEEQCKKLLNAFYVEGKRMKQIAQEFGFSSDKVAKTQKYRCLEAAKKHYQNLQ